MAVNLPQPPPLTVFSPPPATPKPSATQLHFSRWNNANAEQFTQKQRHQQEIESEIRRDRRFTSAAKIVQTHKPPATPATANDNFRSVGTPSSPSRPSIPGKKSKHSKPPNPNPNPTHPAFSRVFKTPKFALSKLANQAPGGVQVGETGVTYRVPNAPFEYQYSYTETPKVKPLALREPPFVPFGPTTMPRPWTGRAPLPASKKKLPEFDSFRLPPPHKKGVKPVQAPGPFLAGMGPRYVRSREEILGEPLMEEEIKELIQSCLRTRRQLNMGRDGLTHNMLDNIHAHWKRRRVCKIKCKGVCTVDMDNVRQQLEEKTGGKIIYSRGGVLFLFRGRNYNFRNRPRFPLMLWKPVTPVYPRLVQQAPEGLTLDEAREMRKRGRVLPPICKLGKNGVYTGLVKHVREAFEVCELVRINCQGMNASDFKKIGAKLKDLVPCVLVSFEHEHILIWRGPDWQSSLTKLNGSAMDGAIITPPDGADLSSVEQGGTSHFLPQNQSIDDKLDLPDDIWSASDNEGMDLEGPVGVTPSYSSTSTISSVISTNGSPVVSDITGNSGDQSVTSTLVPTIDKTDDESEVTSTTSEQLIGIGHALEGTSHSDDWQTLSEDLQNPTDIEKPSSICTAGILLLQKKAVESGSAMILEDASLDADAVYERSVAFAKGAPPGPVFRHSVRKVLVRTRVKQGGSGSKETEVVTFAEEVVKKKSFKNQRVKDFRDVNSDPLPYGSLGVDELAKLLG